MRLGLTYDLRQDYLAAGYDEETTAEFDHPDTVEAIERTLNELGHSTIRIGNLGALVARLAGGERWDLVFNIAEGLHGFGREAQVPALLDAYQIPYTFSDPLCCALTLHKASAKQVARGCGIATADFAVIHTLGDVLSVNLPYPLFAKPVAEGTGKGIDPSSKVDHPEQLSQVCRRLLARYRQPVLIERYLPGEEFTVGILGTGPAAETLGVMQVLLRPQAEAHGYSYINKEGYATRVDYRLAHGAVAERLAATALAAWRALGCRDGGRVDLRLDAAGTPHFLEVNPLAGLHPVHSDLPILCGLVGIDYRQLLARILASALTRSHAPVPAAA